MNKLHSRIAIGGLFFMHGICFSTWASRIPAVQEKLQLSEAQLGTILFAVPIGSIASMPIAAWMVARAGSRKVLFFAILMYATTLVTLGLAAEMTHLMALLAVFGLASNLVNVALNTQAVQSEKLYGRPIMASFHGLWSLAGFVGASLGVVMIGAEVTPFRHFLLAFSVILTGAFIASRHLLPEAPAEASVRRPALARPDRSLLGLGLICFCVMVCEGTMYDWSGIYFAKVLNAQGSWIGVGYVAFMTAMAGTRFIADSFKNRFGLGPVLRWSGVAIFTGLMTSVLLPSMVTSVLGLFLVGAGVSAVVPLVLSEAGATKTMAPSAAIAVVSTIGFLGFLIGPPLIGWIAEATSLRGSFSVVALLGLGIFGLAMKWDSRP